MVDTIFLENEFGEKTENYVLGGTSPAVGSIAANTIVGNLTGGAAIATANTVAAVATALPTAQITAKLLTGLAVGTNTPIAAGDTILGALAKLQAQISAL